MNYISLIDYLPYIFEGLLWSLALVLGGLGLGFTIGLPIGTILTYGDKYTKFILNVYIWIFRSTPLIVLLFLFYWGVFPNIGLKLSPLITSIIVLGLRSGAYQSEIFRGALESVDEGQILAAYSLGMSKIQTVISITIPQALRISIPSLSNEYAILLKDSAICFTIGVLEVLTRARIVSIATGIALIPYLIAGIILMTMTYIGLKIFHTIYKKTAIPGLIRGV